MFNSTLKTKSLLPVVLCLSVTLGATVLPMFADCVETAGGETTNGTAATSSAHEPIVPDYFIEAETVTSQTEFQHESFSIRSVVESSIKYYEAGKQDKKTAYETLWFHQGKAIGLERNAGLDIPADKKVAIRINHASCSTFDEGRASANVVMRMALDVLRNRDKIAVVEVPSAAYQSILEELQARHAQVLPAGQEAPAGARVSFQFESESTGLRQTVYFI
ncbi:MAG: hypothetical protein SGJ27_26995 [Candidatus Melainabacteria bacterium]|nr:hypothetical protein [Candidatus Melainabacteria bacterium]